MRRFDGKYNSRDARRFTKLLNRRKNPLLTAEGINDIARGLTALMHEPITFFMFAYPKKEYADKEEIRPEHLQKADRMNDTEGNHYLPLFVTPGNMEVLKKEPSEGEYIYLCGKQDILDFLMLNKDAAAVINPMKDDLLVYPEELRNLIYAEKELAKAY